MINLTDDDGEYLIPITDILKEGFFLNFKELGFERQIFYPLEKIKTHKIKSHV